MESIPLPDYTKPPERFDLPYTPNSSYYFGALTVLNLLGANETLPQADLVARCRSLIHECRYTLNEIRKSDSL